MNVPKIGRKFKHKKTFKESVSVVPPGTFHLSDYKARKDLRRIIRPDFFVGVAVAFLL